MPEATPRFADLGLDAPLLDALTTLGYDTPTPIQKDAIPELLAGRDIVGQAQTGTGKTAAFGLPLLQAIDPSVRAVQALVMAPTRELALQVSKALEGYGQKVRGLRVLTVYGGAPIGRQLRALDRGVHVVVGTPGRVMDCIRRGALSLAEVRFAVLDEADEMLQMGFIEDIEAILSETPKERQTALLSATMPGAIRRVAQDYLVDPVTVKAESKTRTAAGTKEHVLLAHRDDKAEVLARVLEVEDTDATLVFVRTKAGCRELSVELTSRGFATAELHGDMGQAEREEVVRALTDGRVDLVVATDVAARGLDVDRISHVVNFDPPNNPETYVHRIGRTGRAGREGVSILVLTPRERRLQGVIERFTRQRMTSMSVPSNADLAKRRGADLASSAEAAMDEQDLAPYRELVERMTEELGGDPLEVAAALAHLCSQDRPLVIDEPAPVEPTSKRRSSRRDDRPSRGGSGRPQHDSGERQRLFISMGSSAGLRPADIVGALANETALTGRDIGPIDIRHNHSFVGVPAEMAEEVIERMANAQIRGRNTRVNKAYPPGRRPKHVNRQGARARQR